jgi:hypothetical protein
VVAGFQVSISGRFWVSTEGDDVKERERRAIGRPAKAEPFRSVIAEILAREPDLLSVEILRRAKLQGYAGGKTAALMPSSSGSCGTIWNRMPRLAATSRRLLPDENSRTSMSCGAQCCP